MELGLKEWKSSAHVLVRLGIPRDAVRKAWIVCERSCHRQWLQWRGRAVGIEIIGWGTWWTLDRKGAAETASLEGIGRVVMLFNYSDRRWAESSDRSEKHNEKELHRDGQMGMCLWILSMDSCDLLSYHQGSSRYQCLLQTPIQRMHPGHVGTRWWHSTESRWTFKIHSSDGSWGECWKGNIHTYYPPKQDPNGKTRS